MRLRLLLAAMVLTLALLPAGVQAETPTWWEQCEALPDEQVEECFYEHNGETSPGERPPSAPTSPLRSYIERVYAETHSVFLNCPGNNRLGEDGLACEFRFLHHGTVIKGNAAVEAETETWSHTAWWLTAFSRPEPSPQGMAAVRPRPSWGNLRISGAAVDQRDELRGGKGSRVPHLGL